MSLEGLTVDQVQALAELAQGLSSNPKTRQGFLSLTKQANPDTSIPEIDIPANLRTAMAEPLARLDALQKKQDQRDLEDRINARRQELRDKGVTAAELPKLEKLMVEKGIANHETALEHLRLQERAAVPTPASTSTGVRKFDPLPTMKDFGGDMKKFSYGAAYAAIDELRGRKAAA